MKKNALIATAIFLCACASAPKAPVSLTSEPSIERAFDILEQIPEGRELIAFLQSDPIQFEYDNTAGLCHKFALLNGKIYLPRELRASDTALAMAVGKAAYIYKVHAQTGLDDVIAEEEELGVLFMSKIAIALGVRNEDFKGNAFTEGIKNEFCKYVIEGPRYAMEAARKTALSDDPDCQRPLDTLSSQKAWLEKTRNALNQEKFFQLLHDRDMRRVAKGVMTTPEAMANDKRIRAMPTYDLYRFQRSYYDRQSGLLSTFDEIYKKDQKGDELWRQENSGLYQKAREEFSSCGL